MFARRRRDVVKKDPKIERRPDGLVRSHLLTTPWIAMVGALAAVALWQSPAPAITMPPELLAQTIPLADDEDVRLLAATAWAEARSEGEYGMRAVAHVMVNRVGPRFGDDLETVLRAPRQFSAWNVGDPNRPLVLNPERYARGGINRVTWEQAQSVAREVLEGRSIDPTGGALFYHTRAIHPYWSDAGVGKRIIGAHVFYADVPNTAPRQRYAAQTQQVAQFDDAPRGRRAGRVNGVIQYAPAGFTGAPAAVTSEDAAAPAPIADEAAALDSSAVTIESGFAATADAAS